MVWYEKSQDILVNTLPLLDALKLLFLKQWREQRKGEKPGNGGKEAGERSYPKMNLLLLVRPLCYHQPLITGFARDHSAEHWALLFFLLSCCTQKQQRSLKYLCIKAKPTGKPSVFFSMHFVCKEWNHGSLPVSSHSLKAEELFFVFVWLCCHGSCSFISCSTH